MNQSSAGDQLGISVGKAPQNSSFLSVSGYVDILHTCGKTGEVTDYSGENAILQKGLDAMLSNMSGIAMGGDVSPTKVGIAFSASNPTLTLGSDFTFGTGQNIVPITANLSAQTAANEVFENGCLFDSNAGSAVDVFTGETIGGTAPSRSIVTNDATALVLVAGADGIEIDTIALINSTGSSAGQVLCARSCTTAGAALAGNLGMARITMNNTDTLSVTWTITITST